MRRAKTLPAFALSDKTYRERFAADTLADLVNANTGFNSLLKTCESGHECETICFMISTASDEAIVFGGRIRARAGNGIVGAKIEILSHTRIVLANTISIEGGSYRIRLLRRSIDSEKQTLTIRALSGSGKLLVTRTTTIAATESVIDLLVPAERLKDFRPAAQFLPRFTGSIMNPESLASIESAIRLIIPEHEAGHERLAHLSRKAMPPLARFESVLQDSWDVLAGDLDAAQRLRRALTFLADAGRADSDRISAPSYARNGEFGLQELAYRALPTTPLADIDVIPFGPPVCPAQTDRLVPIMAATLRIATGAEDAAVLLGGLDIGLQGLNSFEFLTMLGQEALSSGNPAPLADELKRLGAKFERDGDFGLEDDFDWPLPPPEPLPPQTFYPCARLTRDCFRNLVEDWRLRAGIQNLAPVYSISSVTRSDACPGETVVITGIGFGGIPGQVVFPHQDGVSTITVDPVVGTWTNTSVSAVVPDEAGSGTLRLLIQEGLVSTCEGQVPVYVQGNGIAFDGGAGFVTSVTINGRATGTVVAPGSPFTLAWKASPANRNVVIFVRETSTNLSLFSDVRPASGTMTLMAPPLTSRGEIRAIVFASPDLNRPACGQGHNRQAQADINLPVSLKIEGVEVTQGIQVFSLGGAQNTLKTVAGKDTIVRVYVSANTGSSSFRSTVPDVTGYLSLDASVQNPGTRLFPINGITPANPSGGNPFITARAAADINRTLTDHTLNFRIPAALANGTKSLTVVVWDSAPVSTRLYAASSMTWKWEAIPPLTVRFLLVQDTTGGVPSEAQAQFTLQRALDLLPTPASNIAPAWPGAQVLSGTDGRVEILRLIRRHISPDPATGMPDKAGWIGLTLGPILLPFFGITSGSVSLAPIYTSQDLQGPFRIVAAHEITHWLLGRCHTDDTNPVCAGATGSNLIGDVIFDSFWNEAVAGTQSYFQTVASVFVRHWIRPLDWDRIMPTIITWEARP
jgi:hypothetical protein